MKGAIQAVGAVFLVTVLASWAAALEIQVAPQMLVLSSAGGKLTVHTDVPYVSVEKKAVILEVEGKEIPEPSMFADSVGNLVVQTTKDVVKDILGDFEGKFTTAEVVLVVEGDGDAETIGVKK